MTRNSRRSLWVVGLSAIALGGFALLRLQNERATKPKASGAPIYVGMPLRTGDIYRYRLELESQLGAGGGSIADYSLKGTWIVAVLKADASGATLQAHIDGASLAAKSAGAATPIDGQVKQRIAQAERDFGESITYTLDGRGVLQQVSDAPKAELQTRSMMRSLAAAGQVVRTAGDEAQWEIAERDGTGDYLARYQRKSVSELSKQKARYTQLSPQAGPVVQEGGGLDVLSSNTRIVLDDSGLLRELDGKETLQATGKTLGGMRATTQLRLVWLGKDRMKPAAVAAATATLPATDSEPNVYAREGSYSPEADRARIAGRTFHDFMADLNSLPFDEKKYTEDEKSRRRRAFIGLAALFRQDPQTVDDALGMVESGSKWSSLLWDILGSAGSPEAQAALRKIIEMPNWNQEQRLAQMIDLSMVELPTKETVTFLEVRLDDREQHTQARYGLGTTALRLKDRDPELAAKIVETLNTKIETAKSSPDRIEYLKALGNSGHVDALATLEEHLKSDDGRMRSTALSSLRFLEGEQVNPWIAGALLEDRENNVRYAAAEVASWRPPSDELLRALAQAWKNDSDEEVRKRAFATISHLDGQYPGLLKELDSMYAAR